MPTDEELDAILAGVRARMRPAYPGEPFIKHDDKGELLLIVPRPGNMGGPDGYRRKPPNGPWEHFAAPIDWLKKD